MQRVRLHQDNVHALERKVAYVHENQSMFDNVAPATLEGGFAATGSRVEGHRERMPRTRPPRSVSRHLVG
jgi:hypothetical protein